MALGIAAGVAAVLGVGRALEIDREGLVHRSLARRSPSCPLGIFVSDAVGARRVPGAPSGGPIVEVLGDSFTFGNGVEDADAYPARLQQELGPRVAVRNRAIRELATAMARAPRRNDASVVRVR